MAPIFAGLHQAPMVIHIIVIHVIVIIVTIVIVLLLLLLIIIIMIMMVIILMIMLTKATAGLRQAPKAPDAEFVAGSFVKQYYGKLRSPPIATIFKQYIYT